MLSMNIRMGSLARLQESLRNLDDGDVKLWLVVHGIREILYVCAFQKPFVGSAACLIHNIHASFNASRRGCNCYGHGKISHSK